MKLGIRGIAFSLTVVVLLQSVLGLDLASRAYAVGVIVPVPHVGFKLHAQIKSHNRLEKKRTGCKATRKDKARGMAEKLHDKRHSHLHFPVVLPQNLVGLLKSSTVASGVIYKSYRGAININLIDVDMVNAQVQVRPVLAGDAFNRLADVKNHAKQSRAIAAVNANYFKSNGTPLGTLIINKEWVAGPLYDRVSLGITQCGFVRIDRVNLYGILKTSVPQLGSIWVNNINQPRRTGAKLIAYTRRWGSHIRMPYAGCLVAVNNRGEVVDKSTTLMGIPWGGFVLSDRKGSKISKLQRGDVVQLSWHTRPSEWSDVVSAVSGGPMLIKDGALFLDLKSERFRQAWTGRGIKARTAAGVTANNHLLLATIEGSHTLWDFAKFLQKLGCVDAMNLDGGGSTTMVVNGQTVTNNKNTYQRRVASSLAIVDACQPVAYASPTAAASGYHPTVNLLDFCLPPDDSNTFLPEFNAFDDSRITGGGNLVKHPLQKEFNSADEVSSASQVNLDAIVEVP